jgi:hypothetical protein
VIQPTWGTARLKRRIALDQAECWADEWNRLAHKVPKRSRLEHPTRKIYTFWAELVVAMLP